jgi:hypothetical protein
VPRLSRQAITFRPRPSPELPTWFRAFQDLERRPDVAFHNHTAGESVEGADAVREHVANIFRNWPEM